MDPQFLNQVRKERKNSKSVVRVSKKNPGVSSSQNICKDRIYPQIIDKIVKSSNEIGKHSSNFKNVDIILHTNKNINEQMTNSNNDQITKSTYKFGTVKNTDIFKKNRIAIIPIKNDNLNFQLDANSNMIRIVKGAQENFFIDVEQSKNNQKIRN